MRATTQRRRSERGDDDAAGAGMGEVVGADRWAPQRLARVIGPARPRLRDYAAARQGCLRDYVAYAALDSRTRSGPSGPPKNSDAS